MPSDPDHSPLPSGRCFLLFPLRSPGVEVLEVEASVLFNDDPGIEPGEGHIPDIEGKGVKAPLHLVQMEAFPLQQVLPLGVETV